MLFVSEGKMANTTEIRHWFIELHAWWEGQINSTMLSQQFELSRQAASSALKTYREAINPNSLIYDTHSKAYRPSDTMKLTSISGDVAEYLHWVSEHRIPAPLSPGFESLKPPERSVSPQVMRAMIKAQREQRRLEVDYVSLTNPNNEGRIIVPHTFVNAGVRWHLRAWCEKSQQYRDFVLSRFRGTPELLDTSSNGKNQDTAWNTPLELVFAPDPRLNDAQKAVLMNDYQMSNGTLIVETRAALAQYLIQEMQVSVKILDGTPEAQQLVLVNKQEVKGWLFGD
jgi:hypothetical protein